MTIKLIETDSNFLEVAGHKFHLNQREFFTLPFWYEKISEGVYREYRFKDLPQELIEEIQKNRL